MKNISVTLLVFLYIYPIPFIFLPISTRVLFGILGFILFIYMLLKNKQRIFKIDKKFMLFVSLLFSLGFISMISLVINNNIDIEFIKYVVSMVVILFASFFVIKILKKIYSIGDFKNISIVVINVILIQSIIAFFMFIFPDFRNFMMSLQRISTDDLALMSNLVDFRIIGFGIYFFGAGVISGFGLILIGMLLRIYKFTSNQIIFLAFKFLLILVVGMMMARTTLIGGLLGLMLILFPKDLKLTIVMFRKRLSFFLYILIIPIVLILILFFMFPKIGESLQPLFNFAFEIFINYFEKGSAESASTNRLQEMYIFPQDIKTWVIGDGLWSAPDGSGYYMHTDVGYLRLIYYFGLLGLFVYLLMQFVAIRTVFKNYNLSIIFYLTVFTYLLILNLKGFADLLSFMFLFWMSFYLTKGGKKNCKTN